MPHGTPHRARGRQGGISTSGPLVTEPPTIGFSAAIMPGTGWPLQTDEWLWTGGIAVRTFWRWLIDGGGCMLLDDRDDWVGTRAPPPPPPPPPCAELTPEKYC